MNPIDPINSVAVNSLTTALTLPEVAPDVFVGHHQRIPSGRAYGGEIVAQAATAMENTVGPDRRIHSLHGYFLRPGDVDEATTWSVERVRDGRGFSARAVRGTQRGKEIFAAQASFHVGASGAAHQRPMPELPDPESLPTAADLLVATDVRDARYWSYERHFDLRHDPGAVYVDAGEQRVFRQIVWARATDDLPAEPAVHRRALAYLCDYTLLEPALRYHGFAWSDPGVVTASLDHAMWWHADARVDDWVALVQEVPISGDGRALATATVYAQSGAMLANVVQEGMLVLPIG